MVRTEDYNKDPKLYMNRVFDFLGVSSGTSLDEKQWTAIVGDTRNLHANSAVKDPMLPETKKLLEDFYAPYNKVLATLASDPLLEWADADADASTARSGSRSGSRTAVTDRLNTDSDSGIGTGTGSGNGNGDGAGGEGNNRISIGSTGNEGNEMNEGNDVLSVTARKELAMEKLRANLMKRARRGEKGEKGERGTEGLHGDSHQSSGSTEALHRDRDRDREGLEESSTQKDMVESDAVGVVGVDAYGKGSKSNLRGAGNPNLKTKHLSSHLYPAFALSSTIEGEGLDLAQEGLESNPFHLKWDSITINTVNTAIPIPISIPPMNPIMRDLMEPEMWLNTKNALSGSESKGKFKGDEGGDVYVYTDGDGHTKGKYQWEQAMQHICTAAFTQDVGALHFLLHDLGVQSPFYSASARPPHPQNLYKNSPKSDLAENAVDYDYELGRKQQRGLEQAKFGGYTAWHCLSSVHTFSDANRRSLVFAILKNQTHWLDPYLDPPLERGHDVHTVLARDVVNSLAISSMRIARWLLHFPLASGPTHASDSAGNTPLHHAVEGGMFDLSEFLVGDYQAIDNDPAVRARMRGPEEEEEEDDKEKEKGAREERGEERGEEKENEKEKEKKPKNVKMNLNAIEENRSKNRMHKLIDQQNHEGRTPSHVAANYGHSHLLGLLADHGADWNIKDNFGVKVSDILSSAGPVPRECAIALLKKGAPGTV